MLRRKDAYQEMADAPRKGCRALFEQVGSGDTQHIAADAALIHLFHRVAHHARIPLVVSGRFRSQIRVFVAGEYGNRVMAAGALFGHGAPVELGNHAADGLKELVLGRPAMRISAPFLVNRRVAPGYPARFRICQQLHRHRASIPGGDIARREGVGPMGNGANGPMDGSAGDGGENAGGRQQQAGNHRRRNPHSPPGRPQLCWPRSDRLHGTRAPFGNDVICQERQRENAGPQVDLRPKVTGIQAKDRLPGDDET